MPTVSRNNRLRAGVSILLALLGSPLWASDGGSLLGTITDPNGAAVPGANITATETASAVKHTIATDGRGFFSFRSLPVGRYNLLVDAPGFKPLRRTGIVIDVDSKVVADASLTLGERTETVTVSGSAAHVETVDTQMGEVITGQQMTAVPLNGRSFTDLLALQSGVVPVTSLTSDTTQDVGVSALSPSGDLNPGTISINGQREFANSFVLNGSDVEEDVNMGAAIVPNLDSIAEFRILTSNFDAEYGEFSGGQINVVTKSGTNAFHGDAFEFLRNTDLDARNFFSPTRGAFDQNQFGGTIGGPIRKNQVFFFADYQGTRSTQGIDTGEIPVPSLAERAGDFGGFSGPVGDLSNLLSRELGYTVSPDAPLKAVLPGGVIPQQLWSAPAQHLLQYIPAPNNPNGTFSTSAYNETLQDDKGAYRLDSTTRWGMLSAYYFLDGWSQNNPYPVAQGGANLPGFNALNTGRAQLLALGDTKTLSSTAVNEFHFSFMRDATDLGQPIGGIGTTLASQGFVVGANTPGIVPLSPKTEGVESVDFNNFSIGTNTNELKQVNNTFQWRDNFSKVLGTHTILLGAEFHYDQVNTNPIAQLNGNFIFFGSETGIDFADFLLGVPSQYNQSQLQAFYGRNKYAGLYGQDSWRVTKNLTLNYGLRWDRIEPWYEKYNQIATFEPGRQSVVFPGAPAGILFPTDPGVPRTIATAGKSGFRAAHRPCLLARQRKDQHPGQLRHVLHRDRGAVDWNQQRECAVWNHLHQPRSAAVCDAVHHSGQRSKRRTIFPRAACAVEHHGQPSRLRVSTGRSSNPSAGCQTTRPITGFLTPRNTCSPSSTASAITRCSSASYVGTQSHHLLVLEEANPGNPALCLQLSNPANLAPGQTPCGPFSESNVFVTASGQMINGTRGPLGSNFGSDTLETTIGNSNYNSLQVTLRHTSGPLQLLAAYTYSKSLDQSSNLGEEVNPLNPSLSRALSAFDMTQNFVVSYNYQLPFARLLHATNRWTQGWELSGITRFSTGLPVTLVNYGDNSLLGAEPNGINNYGDR